MSAQTLAASLCGAVGLCPVVGASSLWLRAHGFLDLLTQLGVHVGPVLEGPRQHRLAHPDTMTFYASRPGAFADLVADLGGSRHLDPGALSLDADLTVPDPGPDTGLAMMASIHQAIGVLVDHGFSPTDAAGELHRRALCTGTSRHATATRLLGDAHPGPGIRSR